ncbi:MAG: VOC family protein [Clostridia bacterium]
MTFEFNHVCSNVRNMDTTIKFYTEVLGAQVTYDKVMESNGSRCVYVQINNNLVELIEPGTHTPETPYGLKHIAFETDDLDGAFEYFKGLGYKFHIEPKVAGTGNGRLSFFTDQNGVAVEILQRPLGMRRPPVEPKIVVDFDHYSLRANNLKDVHELYSKHLQMKNIVHFMLEDRDLEIIYMQTGDDVLELLHNSVPKDFPNPIAHIALRVENVRTAVDQLIALGVDISHDKINKAGIGIGETITFQDPDGVPIELVDRPALQKLEENGYTTKTLHTLRDF